MQSDRPSAPAIRPSAFRPAGGRVLASLSGLLEGGGVAAVTPGGKTESARRVANQNPVTSWMVACCRVGGQMETQFVYNTYHMLWCVGAEV
jgi:hypothetical protein